MCGIRAPTAPFPQELRVRHDFVAFLVVKGAIRLRDRMGDGDDVRSVRAGDIHIVAPGIWQESVEPFAPGIVFLWFHFLPDGDAGYECCDAGRAGAILHAGFGGAVPRPQTRWLVPRQIALGDDLPALRRAHDALLTQTRLHGTDDAGSDALCTYLVHALHRRYATAVLGEAAPGLHGAEVHVARAQAVIRTRYDRGISAIDVAAELDLDPSYLGRCFRRVTGRTITDALHEARLDSAIAHLRDGLSVKEAAAASGFASATYFCRIFRRRHGVTPLEALRRHEPLEDR